MSDTDAGEAFGYVPRDAWDSGDRHGRELRDPFVVAPDSLWELVGEVLASEVDDWHYVSYRV